MIDKDNDFGLKKVNLKQYKFNQLSSRVLSDLDGKSKKNVAIKDLGCKYF